MQFSQPLGAVQTTAGPLIIYKHFSGQGALGGHWAPFSSCSWETKVCSGPCLSVYRSSPVPPVLSWVAATQPERPHAGDGGDKGQA